MDPSRIFDEFPAPSFQGEQQQALSKIKTAFQQPGTNVVLVQAPTGSGKSLLARAIAGCAADPSTATGEKALKAYYTSPQVSQIDDVDDDEFLQDINVIYGQSNYSCILPSERGVPVTRAKCSRNPNMDCHLEHRCPYFAQRKEAQEGDIAGMTLAYFMEMAQTELFGKRDVLVIDEAHSLAQWAELYASIKLGPDTIPNWSEQKPNRQEINALSDVTQYVSRLTAVLVEWREKFRSLEEPSADNARLRDHLENLVPDLEWFLESVRDGTDSTEWVYDWGQKDALTLKPLHPQRFLKHALWERGQNIALLSATFLNKESFCRNIGISPENATLVNVPHSFPVENRPLHDATQGFMTKEHRGETLPKIASAIVQLMDRHRDEKGLIHCHSYSIKQQLVDAVRKESTTPSRVMSHSSNDRDQMLESWKQKNGNEVFFSVKMEEALDLKYELCRWQAITKAPYKHTADPIVNHRLEENDEWAWYYRTALRTIIQACGRVVRQPDDYGDTYILDRSILDVFERARSDMPDWFKSQVRRMDEIDLTAQQSNPQF